MTHFANDPHHAHFITFSCNKRLWLFKSPILYRDFLQTLCRDRHGFLLIAFVVMPNHVHLLIQPPDSVTISSILRAIKQPFTHRALSLLQSDFPDVFMKLAEKKSRKTIHRFWQAGGGFDRNLTDPEKIRRAIEYMHNNPVRKELVRTPTEWPWSSALFWERGVNDPFRIDRPEWI